MPERWWITEKNQNGKYVHFDSAGDLWAVMKDPERCERLLSVLQAVTYQKSDANIRAWEKSLRDLALLLVDPDKYLKETVSEIPGMKQDVESAKQKLRLDMELVCDDLSRFLSYEQTLTRMMSVEEYTQFKDRCYSVRKTIEELEEEFMGTEEQTGAVGEIMNKISETEKVLEKELEAWEKSKASGDWQVSEHVKIDLEFPVKEEGAQRTKRIDVLLRRGRKLAVIELKQWTENYESRRDLKPDEQADRYVDLLKKMYPDCEIRGFAYLHNQMVHKGHVYQGRSIDKNRSFMYTKHYCGAFYRQLAAYFRMEPDGEAETVRDLYGHAGMYAKGVYYKDCGMYVGGVSRYAEEPIEFEVSSKAEFQFAAERTAERQLRIPIYITGKDKPRVTPNCIDFV